MICCFGKKLLKPSEENKEKNLILIKKRNKTSKSFKSEARV